MASVSKSMRASCGYRSELQAQDKVTLSLLASNLVYFKRFLQETVQQ